MAYVADFVGRRRTENWSVALTTWKPAVVISSRTTVAVPVTLCTKVPMRVGEWQWSTYSLYSAASIWRAQQFVIHPPRGTTFSNLHKSTLAWHKQFLGQCLLRVSSRENGRGGIGDSAFGQLLPAEWPVRETIGEKWVDLEVDVGIKDILLLLFWKWEIYPYTWILMRKIQYRRVLCACFILDTQCYLIYSFPLEG